MKFTLVLVAAALLITSCEEKKNVDEQRFVEFVEVTGTCSEDHVGQVAHYEGSLVHWHNVTKDTHSRYGSAQLSGGITQEVMAQLEDPYTYRPPFLISFLEVAESEMAKPALRLRGISNYYSDDTGRDKYWATCNLRVVARSDHLPPSGAR